MKEISRKGVPDSELTDIVVGTVVSISPIEIHIENGLKLYERNVTLSPLCIAKSITFSFTDSAGDGATVTTQLWRGLQAGDNVVAIKAGKGQSYYILQRKGAL